MNKTINLSAVQLERDSGVTAVLQRFVDESRPAARDSSGSAVRTSMGLIPDGTPLSLQSFFLDQEIKLQRQRLKHMLQPRQVQQDHALLASQRQQEHLCLKHCDPEQRSAWCMPPAPISYDRCSFSPQRNTCPVPQVSVTTREQSDCQQLVASSPSLCSSFAPGVGVPGVSGHLVASSSDDGRGRGPSCSQASSPPVLSPQSTDGVKLALGGSIPSEQASRVPDLSESAGAFACTISVPAPATVLAPENQMGPNATGSNPPGRGALTEPCSGDGRREDTSCFSPHANSSRRVFTGSRGGSQEELVSEDGTGDHVSSIKKSVTRLDLSMAVYQRMKTVDIPRGTESEVLEEVQEVLVGSPCGRDNLVQSEGSADDLSALLNQRSAEGVEHPRGEGSSPSPERLGREASKLQLLAEKLQAQEEEKRVMQEESFQVEQLLKRQYFQDMQKKDQENAHLKRQLDGLKEEVEALNRHLSATLQHQDQLKHALALAQDAFSHAVDSMLFTPRTPCGPGRSPVFAEPLKKTAEHTSLRHVSRASPELRQVSDVAFRSDIEGEGGEAGQETKEREREERSASESQLGQCRSKRTGSQERAPDAEERTGTEQYEEELFNDERGSLSAKLWALMGRLEDAVARLDSVPIDGADKKVILIL